MVGYGLREKLIPIFIPIPRSHGFFSTEIMKQNPSFMTTPVINGKKSPMFNLEILLGNFLA